MNKQRRQTIRAELARRMGWTVNGCYAIAPEGTDLNVLYPRGRLYGYPDPFTNAEDNRALVAWLAADDARWTKFTDQLFIQWNKVRLDEERKVKPGAIDWERFILTAPHEAITLAAARALGIQEAGE